MIKKKVLLLLKILFSATLIGLIIYKVGFKSVITTIGNIPLIIILLFILNPLISIFIGAINIKLLSDTIKKISLINMIRYTLLSWTIGLMSPGKLGEFSILLFLKKKQGITYGQGLAISIIDKIITIISLIGISSLIFITFIPERTIIGVALILLFGTILLFLGLLSDKGRNIIKKYILRGHSEKFLKFNFTFKKLIIKHPLRITLNLILTIVKWFITSSITFIGIIYLGGQISLLSTFSIVCVSLLVSLVPISLSGLGIRELTFVGLMSSFGVSTQISLSLSLLSLIIVYLVATISIFVIKIEHKEKANTP